MARMMQLCPRPPGWGLITKNSTVGADSYGSKVPVRVRRAPGQRGGRPEGALRVLVASTTSAACPPRCRRRELPGQCPAAAVLLREVQVVPAEVRLLPKVGHSCRQWAQDEFGVVLEQADLHTAFTEQQDGGSAGVKPGTRAR